MPETSDLLSTLNRFAEVLQTEKKPWDVLRELVELVRDYANAAHAKVLVVQREGGQPGLEQLCRTDDPSSFSRKIVPISQVGLANWVVKNQMWLVVPEVPADWPAKSVPFPTHAGQPGRAKVLVQEEVWAEFGDRFNIQGAVDRVRHSDNEHTMLFVPLGGENGTAGVLALWRDRTGSARPKLASFAVTDALAVLEVAPFLAAACQLVLQQRALEDELEAVKELSQRLYDAKTLGAAYIAIAEGLGRLGGASHAILLQADPDRSGYLYHRATWSAKATDFRISDRLQGLHLQIPPESGLSWKEHCCEQINWLFKKLPGPRPIATPARVLAVDNSNPEKMVAALLDSEVSFAQPRFFAGHRSHEVGLSFLRSANAMLPNHLQTYASQCLEELSLTETLSGWGPSQLLEKAAELLHNATGASATLVYSGPGAALGITSTTPKNDKFLGREISANSLARRCVEEKKSIRVVDTSDPTDERVRVLDLARLEETRKSYGWERIRSWVVSPVIDRGRCVGVLEFLTADRDGFLGKDHEGLATALAKRAAWEIRKLNRRLQIDSLNRLANELTDVRGAALGARIVRELETWASQYLRPDVAIALFTRISADRRLVDAKSLSVSDDLAGKLSQLSKNLNSSPGTWDAGSKVPLEGGESFLLPQALAAFPLQLPGRKTMQGHLMLLHERLFTEEEREAAQEATREISIVLQSERLNRYWQEQTGRFRHAVIGPVQGLQSTALDLVDELLELKPSIETREAIDSLRNEILKETELIRIWRNNERLYTSEKVEIRPRWQPFQNVFDRCLKRAAPLFVERRVRLQSNWQPSGQAHFSFDEAGLDLVLSNLLDNARKYAFADTAVTVSFESTSTEVILSVEDIGHRIPRKLDEKIYDVNARLDWEYPFRTIEGQGLGLPMARAIVEAHGGTISHQSFRYLRGWSESTTQYGVRFLVKLPISRKV